MQVNSASLRTEQRRGGEQRAAQLGLRNSFYREIMIHEFFGSGASIYSFQFSQVVLLTMLCDEA